MTKLNLYVAPFQNPVSGVTETLNLVRSFGLGKSTVAALPASSSAISMSMIYDLCSATKK